MKSQLKARKHFFILPFTILIACILFPGIQFPQSGTYDVQDALIVLNTNTYPEMQYARKDLESRGVIIDHVFPNQTFFARMDANIISEIQGLSFVLSATLTNTLVIPGFSAGHQAQENTVAIDGEDTGVRSILDDGTNLQQVINSNIFGARNHGEFLSEENHELNELKTEGLITGSEKSLVVTAAANSDIPREPIVVDEGGQFTSDETQRAIIIYNIVYLGVLPAGMVWPSGQGRTPGQDVVCRHEEDVLVGPGPATSFSNYDYSTSAYLAGDVALGLILPESSNETGPIQMGDATNVNDWTIDEVNVVKSNLVAGLNILIPLEPNAKLTFIHHYFDIPPTTCFLGDPGCQPDTVATIYETHGYRPYTGNALVMGDLLNSIYLNTSLPFFYDGGLPFFADNIQALLNALRNEYSADWAFLVAVDDMSEQPFPPEIDTWGRAGNHTCQLPNYAVPFFYTHEISHIFKTPDEYTYSFTNNGITGYLGVFHGNIQGPFTGLGYYNGDGERADCIMSDNATVGEFCSFCRGVLGWRDQDGDGILDPFDTFPNSELTGISGGTVYGVARTTPYIPYKNDREYLPQSINTVERVEVRFNNHAWQEASPVDGSFDSGDEEFSFVPSLIDGQYTIESRSVNDAGNVETSLGEFAYTVASSGVGDSSPFPHLVITPDYGTTNTLFYFDALASDDIEDGGGVQIRLDIDNDGTFEVPWSSTKDVSLTYPSSGEKTVLLEVRDFATPTPNISSLTQIIKIIPVNTSPHPEFEVILGSVPPYDNPLDTQPGNRFETRNPIFYIDTSASFDTEPGNLEVRVDWDSDGIYEPGDDWGTGQSLFSHQYNLPFLPSIVLTHQLEQGIIKGTVHGICFDELNDLLFCAVEKTNGQVVFQIYDTSQLSNTTPALSLIHTSGYVVGNLPSPVVSGDYLFIIDLLNDINVFDVSIPTSPTFIKSISGASFRELAVHGSYIYAAISNGIAVIDISAVDPMNFSLITPLGIFGNWGSHQNDDIAIYQNGSGTYAVVDYYIVDVSVVNVIGNPQVVHTFASCSGVNCPSDMKVVDNYIYQWNAPGLIIYDITNLPAIPSIESDSYSNSLGSSGEIAANSTHVVIKDKAQYLRAQIGAHIVDTSIKALPQDVGMTPSLLLSSPALFSRGGTEYLVGGFTAIETPGIAPLEQKRLAVLNMSDVSSYKSISETNMITVQVRDVSNWVDQTTRTVWANGYDQLPELMAIVSPVSSIGGGDSAEFEVDVTGTSDPDDTETWDNLIEYRVDKDSDGNFDTAFIPIDTTPITLAQDRPDTYTVVVEARDRFFGTNRYVTSYTSNAGVVSSSPTVGCIDGGEVVTIYGSGFLPSSKVYFDNETILLPPPLSSDCADGTLTSSICYVDSTEIRALSPPDTGSYNVSVVQEGIVYDSPDSFSYTTPLSIAGISQVEGCVGGGETVQINGSCFPDESDLQIKFGSDVVPSVDVNRIDASTIEAITPIYSVGPLNIDIEVSNISTGSFDTIGFTYKPIIADFPGQEYSCTPGGVGNIGFSGECFNDGTMDVIFGGSSSSNVNVFSSISLGATPPPHAAGTVDVTVRETGSLSEDIIYGKMHYFGDPVVTGITPDYGTTHGGTEVVITGTGLYIVSDIWFGAESGTNIIFNIDFTQVTVTSPPHAPGLVDITIDTLCGSTISSSAFTYANMAFTANLEGNSLTVIDVDSNSAIDLDPSTPAVRDDFPLVAPWDVVISEKNPNYGFAITDFAGSERGIQRFDIANLTLGSGYWLSDDELGFPAAQSLELDPIQELLYVISPADRAITHGTESVPVPRDIRVFDVSGDTTLLPDTSPDYPWVISVHNGIDADADGFVDGTSILQEEVYPIEMKIVTFVPPDLGMPFKIGDKVTGKNFGCSSPTTPSNLIKRYGFVTTSGQIEKEELCPPPIPGGPIPDCIIYSGVGPNRLSIIDLNECVISGFAGGGSTVNLSSAVNTNYRKEIAVLGSPEGPGLLAPGDPDFEFPNMGLSLAVNAEGQFIYALNQKDNELVKVDVIALDYAYGKNQFPNPTTPANVTGANDVKIWNDGTNPIEYWVSGWDDGSGVGDGSLNFFFEDGSAAASPIVFPDLGTPPFPDDIAFSPAWDYGYLSLYGLGEVKRIDKSTHLVDGSWGLSGLSGPSGLATDAMGNIYVCEYDSLNGRISVFDSTGVLISASDTASGGSITLDGPWDIAIDPGTNNLLVLEYYNSIYGTGTLKEIAFNGVDIWTEIAVLALDFYEPTDVIVQGTRVYVVAEYGNESGSPPNAGSLKLIKTKFGSNTILRGQFGASGVDIIGDHTGTDCGSQQCSGKVYLATNFDTGEVFIIEKPVVLPTGEHPNAAVTVGEGQDQEVWVCSGKQGDTTNDASTNVVNVIGTRDEIELDTGPGPGINPINLAVPPASSFNPSDMIVADFPVAIQRKIFIPMFDSDVVLVYDALTGSGTQYELVPGGVISIGANSRPRTIAIQTIIE